MNYHKATIMENNKQITIQMNEEELKQIKDAIRNLSIKLNLLVNELEESNKILIGSSGDYTEQNKSEK